jgi:hypothetical protein
MPGRVKPILQQRRRLTSVFDCRILKRTSGVRLVAATACPPAIGVAVNLYCRQVRGKVSSI